MVKKKLHSHNVYRKWNWDIFNDEWVGFKGLLAFLLVTGWFAAAFWTLGLILFGLFLTLGDASGVTTDYGWWNLIYVYNIIMMGIWTFYAWATGELYTDKQ